VHQSSAAATITAQDLPISEEIMPTVSQDINQRIALSSTPKSEILGDVQQKLTIAEADIIFYGEDALAGAKEFARLEVGQGFSWMTGGMGKVSVVYVRRGVWALYDAESFRGQMVVVSSGEAEGQLLSNNGIHVLAAPVRSYKRLR
jgi:Beta/Gamma crystallin